MESRYSGIFGIVPERILGRYNELKLVNMTWYTVQATVNRERQNKSVPTSGCFAHLLHRRAKLMAMETLGIDRNAVLILGLRPANVRGHHFVMTILIGWAQA